MTADFRSKISRKYDDGSVVVDYEDVTQALLQDLQNKSNKDGKCLETYGLPSPADTSTELQRTKFELNKNLDKQKNFL